MNIPMWLISTFAVFGFICAFCLVAALVAVKLGNGVVELDK